MKKDEVEMTIPCRFCGGITKIYFPSHKARADKAEEARKNAVLCMMEANRLANEDKKQLDEIREVLKIYCHFDAVEKIYKILNMEKQNDKRN